jgi:glycosyltransferase involved in cell wall biosynthesis
VEGFLEDGLPFQRATVIYNAVDPERLSAGDATRLRADLGVAENEMVLTAVGSLTRNKGFEVLLRALAQVRAAGSAESPFRVRLLVVGDGPHHEELEALTRSLGLAPIVRFLGRRSDVGAILRDATDIALSASRQEALPLNVLEAGFFGLPMVLSDIPPHREVVQHGRTGIIVPAGDAPAFAAAVVDLLENPARRQRLGRAASQHIHSNFLIGRYVREFSELYGELLASPARRYGCFGGWVWPRAYTRWLTRAGQRRLSTVADRLPPLGATRSRTAPEGRNDHPA